MKHFFIVANRDKDPQHKTTQELAAFLRAHDCTAEVLAREKEGGKLRVPAGTQCILVLGGDGTLLRCARDTAELRIPLLGINLGNLGFLAEVDRDGIEESLLHLIRDEYEIEERMMLDGAVFHEEKEVWNTHALNDIVVSRTGNLMVLSYELYVNGLLLNRYLADGIILSTPTGSTGYNLSAGGPIVEPGASLMVITPICPHTLGTRSIVLSAEDQVEIRFGIGKDGEQQRAQVSFDGGMNYELISGDRVCVGRSSRVIRLVHINKISFLKTLQKKMSEK